MARKFSFPAGSTHSDILSISQTLTVCSDQVYDFSLPDPSNTGYCQAWFSTTPAVGTPKTGNKELLFAIPGLAEVWSQFDISEHNAALTSFSITVFMPGRARRELGRERFCFLKLCTRTSLPLRDWALIQSHEI